MAKNVVPCVGSDWGRAQPHHNAQSHDVSGITILFGTTCWGLYVRYCRSCRGPPRGGKLLRTRGHSLSLAAGHEATFSDDSPGLWDSEFQLTSLLETSAKSTLSNRRDTNASNLRRQRAEARLNLKLFDASLEDIRLAGDVHTCAELHAAALAGMHRYSEAIDFLSMVQMPSNMEVVPMEARANFVPENDQRKDTAKSMKIHIETLQKQSTGCFDFASIYWRDSWPPFLPKLADYVGPINLAKLAPHGQRGCCATRDIVEGQVIMVCSALVRSSPSKQAASMGSALSKKLASEAAAQANYTRAMEISPHANRVLSAVLSDGSARGIFPVDELIWRGASKDDAHITLPADINLRGICATNAFEDAEDETIFPAVAMLNHSCVPNCVFVFVGDSLVIRSSRPVKQGEELSISYFDVLKPVKERRMTTLNWNFSCTCPRCQVESVQNLNCFDATGSQSVAADEETLQHFEDAVANLNLSEQESRWCRAGYLKLYQRLAEKTGDSVFYQKIACILEATAPGSFRHCRSALSAYHALANSVEPCTLDACAEDFFDSERPRDSKHDELLQRLWQQCLCAHCLRYGQLGNLEMSKLLKETASSILTQEAEFCQRSSV